MVDDEAEDEDAEEDEWNVSMAAGTCLGLLAQAVQDTVVPAVIVIVIMVGVVIVVAAASARAAVV